MTDEHYTFVDMKQYAQELTDKYGGDVNDTYSNPYISNQKGSLPSVLFAWHQKNGTGKRAMEEWYKTHRQHAENAERTKKQKRGPMADLWEMPL